MFVAKKAKVRKLADLTPIEFENLVFDLLVTRGMVNVAWRTPGADGGRDIESMTVGTDFSGVQSVAKWFVECKKYAGSVDWPTIYGKLAYADALHAEYLLMCTTSKFTPAAITQSDAWNNSRRPLKIRLWPGQELDLQLNQHPDLRLKYGLSSPSQSPGRSLVSLSLALSKAVGSYSSELVFAGRKPSGMLQAAQTFSELVLRRMEDMNEAGRVRPVFRPLRSDSLDECSVKGLLQDIDEVGLRAFAAYLIALTRHRIEIAAKQKGECEISIQVEASPLLNRYRDAFAAISLWSDFEFSFSGKVIFVRQRP